MYILGQFAESYLFGYTFVILGPIYFYFGLRINLIVNTGQNNFEVDILINVAKIANLRPQGGGGSEVNFEILRYVVELDLNFQMLLSLPKTKFPI